MRRGGGRDSIFVVIDTCLFFSFLLSVLSFFLSLLSLSLSMFTSDGGFVFSFSTGPSSAASIAVEVFCTVCVFVGLKENRIFTSGFTVVTISRESGPESYGSRWSEER